MYIIGNALKNLLRNKGRNILIGIITLAIIVTVGVAIIINTTTKGIINDYKNRFGTKVSIIPDIDKLQQSGNMVDLSSDYVTLKQYEEFAKSKYIKEALLQEEASGSSDKIKAIDQDKESNMKMGYINVDGGSTSNLPMPTFRLIGCNTLSLLDDFKEGLRKITSGKIYQKDNECVISEELAKLNSLKVGDTIKIKVQNVKGESTEQSLVISGIYKDITNEYGSSPLKMAISNRRNEILTNFETISKVSNDNGRSVNAKYVLNSPDDLSDFEKEIRALGLSKNYKPSADLDNYKKIVAPVEGLSKISLIFIIVVLILGGIILTLLTSMSVRERKYEIGVLRAMGMNKLKVISGFLSETLIIVAICVGIGTAVSSAIAQPVANTMLEKQIQIVNEQNNKNNGFGIAVAISDAQNSPATIDKLNVSLDIWSFIKISNIAICLACISSIMSIIYITKYEPIKILTERN